MAMSEHIQDLTKALAKAQAEMKPATFDKTNPHFKNKYASLASVIEAVRKPLSDNGIAYTQTEEILAEFGPILVTRLYLGEQWISSVHALPTGVTPQVFGSALTYARRQSLQALCGLAADEDDDANAADGNSVVHQPKKEPVISPERADELLEIITTKGVDINQFLRKAGCPSVSDLPAIRYDAAKKWLQEQGAVRS